MASLPRLCMSLSLALLTLAAGCADRLALPEPSDPSDPPEAATWGGASDAPAAADASPGLAPDPDAPILEWAWSSPDVRGTHGLALALDGPAQSCRLSFEARGTQDDRELGTAFGVAQGGDALVLRTTKSANPQAHAAGVRTADHLFGGGYHVQRQEHIRFEEGGAATVFWAATGLGPAGASDPADAPTFAAVLACPAPFRVVQRLATAELALFGDHSFDGVGVGATAAEAVSGTLTFGGGAAWMLAFTDYGSAERTLTLEHAGGSASWRSSQWSQVSAAVEGARGPVTLTMQHASTLSPEGRPPWLAGIVAAWSPVGPIQGETTGPASDPRGP